MAIQCIFLERIPGDGAKLFRRSDTGVVIPLCMAPVGAMWFADWMQESCDYIDQNEPGLDRGVQSLCRWRGPDGHTLIVRVRPSFDWSPDRRASNCTRLDDDRHKCWVRHGEPPNITVDKQGDTCSAGAGSIVAPDWHGFLRNGRLEP